MDALAGRGGRGSRVQGVSVTRCSGYRQTHATPLGSPSPTDLAGSGAGPSPDDTRQWNGEWGHGTGEGGDTASPRFSDIRNSFFLCLFSFIFKTAHADSLIVDPFAKLEISQESGGLRGGGSFLWWGDGTGSFCLVSFKGQRTIYLKPSFLPTLGLKVPPPSNGGWEGGGGGGGWGGRGRLRD